MSTAAVKIDNAVATRLQAIITEKLRHTLGDQGVAILMEYVWHLVISSKVTRGHMRGELQEFLTEETDSFVEWLDSKILPHIAFCRSGQPPSAELLESLERLAHEVATSPSAAVSVEGSMDNAMGEEEGATAMELTSSRQASRRESLEGKASRENFAIDARKASTDWDKGNRVLEEGGRHREHGRGSHTVSKREESREEPRRSRGSSRPRVKDRDEKKRKEEKRSRILGLAVRQAADENRHGREDRDRRIVYEEGREVPGRVVVMKGARSRSRSSRRVGNDDKRGRHHRRERTRGEAGRSPSFDKERRRKPQDTRRGIVKEEEGEELMESSSAIGGAGGPQDFDGAKLSDTVQVKSHEFTREDEEEEEELDPYMASGSRVVLRPNPLFGDLYNQGVNTPRAFIAASYPPPINGFATPSQGGSGFMRGYPPGGPFGHGGPPPVAAPPSVVIAQGGGAGYAPRSVPPAPRGITPASVVAGGPAASEAVGAVSMITTGPGVFTSQAEGVMSGERSPPSHPQFKVKKKCARWPNCSFGESCRYIHPAVVCTNWPRCSFGNECFYIHPEVACKYGLRCRNWYCNFTHPEGWSPPAMFSFGMDFMGLGGNRVYKNKALKHVHESLSAVATSDDMVLQAEDGEEKGKRKFADDVSKISATIPGTPPAEAAAVAVAEEEKDVDML